MKSEKEHALGKPRFNLMLIPIGFDANADQNFKFNANSDQF